MRTAGVEGNSMGDEQDGERKISYAVAIYPYVAEREDEFDVLVGATFSILNKAKGWWVVQKDPEGTGATSSDETLSGWVPAGEVL
jgi:protein STE50